MDGWHMLSHFYDAAGMQVNPYGYENVTSLTYEYAPVREPVSYVEFEILLTGRVDHTWTQGSNLTVTITVKRSTNDAACFSHFIGVKIDGITLVNGVDYTAAAGSTIVTLQPSLLEKLAPGDHEVTVLFDDGEVPSTLTVYRNPNPVKGGENVNGSGNTGNRYSDTGKAGPRTGDEGKLCLWFAIFVVSAGFVFVIAAYDKKRRNAARSEQTAEYGTSF